MISILSAGITPTSLELLDATSIHGLNLAKLLPSALPEEPTVLMRFGNADEKANFATLESVRALVARHGGRDLQVARNEEENEQLWAARKVRAERARYVHSPCFSHPNFTFVSEQNQYWSQQLLVGDDCRTLVG